MNKNYNSVKEECEHDWIFIGLSPHKDKPSGTLYKWYRCNLCGEWKYEYNAIDDIDF